MTLSSQAQGFMSLAGGPGPHVWDCEKLGFAFTLRRCRLSVLLTARNTGVLFNPVVFWWRPGGVCGMWHLGLSLPSQEYKEDCPVFRRKKALVSIDWVLVSPVGRCVLGKVIALLLHSNTKLAAELRSKSLLPFKLRKWENHFRHSLVFKSQVLWSLSSVCYAAQ